MPQKALSFVIIGIIWLFLFSIPLGQGRTVFDVAHHYVVDSTPVHWILGQVDETISETDRVSRRAGDWVESNQEKLSQSESYYDFTE